MGCSKLFHVMAQCRRLYFAAASPRSLCLAGPVSSRSCRLCSHLSCVRPRSYHAVLAFRLHLFILSKESLFFRSLYDDT